MSKTYDVTGIGNAIVDILAHVNDEFITKHNMQKGSMQLINQEQAEALYKDFPPSTEISGGSAGNTIAGIASFGGKCAFIGKVRHDDFGRVYRHDMLSLNVEFTTKAAESGAATARSLIAITPDAQRTMNTFLGTAPFITESDIDEALIAASSITYFEGYLWDDAATKQAIRKAMELTKKHGGKVAFTLSDSFCVHRHRQEFLELAKGPIDILFSNEEEIKALMEVDDFDQAASAIAKFGKINALTRSEKGCVIAHNDQKHVVPAEKITQLVDSTGAGDLFASGFLHGLTRNFTLTQCGKLGNIAASEVIQHIGARPQVSLAELKKKVA